MSEPRRDDILARWRLVLGKFAEPRMPGCLDADGQRMADALEQLYSREFRGRGVRQTPKLGPGSLDPSQLNVPQWLGTVRELFPQQAYERITKHALDRYGMTEIVNDPQTLAKLEPSPEILAAVLAMKGQMPTAVLAEARRLIARVVEEVKKKLEREILGALTGRLNRFRKSRHKVARNFDARGTVRRNLKHWDAERKKLIVEDPLFFNRVRRHLPWEIILCIDQSGSMADSVIHSAVMAGILSALPAVRIRLVVFDTQVVDLTDRASDPVEVLMSVQLGGGTNIGQAVRVLRAAREPAEADGAGAGDGLLRGGRPARAGVGRAAAARGRRAAARAGGAGVRRRAVLRRADGRPARRRGHGDRRADARTVGALARGGDGLGVTAIDLDFFHFRHTPRR